MNNLQMPRRSFSEILKDTGSTAKNAGLKVAQWAQNNPELTASAIAAISMLLSNKKGTERVTNPLIQGGITYGLLKALPFLKNVGGLINNANYATLEAQALMAKGNHLADTVPSAPLLFGRKKAMAKIQKDAINKGNQVFFNAYQKYRSQGRLSSNYGINQIDAIKHELKNVMGA